MLFHKLFFLGKHIFVYLREKDDTKRAREVREGFFLKLGCNCVRGFVCDCTLVQFIEAIPEDAF